MRSHVGIAACNRDAIEVTARGNRTHWLWIVRITDVKDLQAKLAFGHIGRIARHYHIIDLPGGLDPSHLLRICGIADIDHMEIAHIQIATVGRDIGMISQYRHGRKLVARSGNNDVNCRSQLWIGRVAHVDDLQTARSHIRVVALECYSRRR